MAASFGGPIKKDKLFFFASYQEPGRKTGSSAQGFSAPTLLPISEGRPLEHRGLPDGSLGATFCPTGPMRDISSIQTATGGRTGRLQWIEHQSGGHQSSSTQESRWHLLHSQFRRTERHTLPEPPSVFLPIYGSIRLMGNVDYVINSKNTLVGQMVL